MMGDAVPQTPWDLSHFFSRMDVFSLLETAPAVQSRGLIGGQGDAGMRPERRLSSRNGRGGVSRPVKHPFWRKSVKSQGRRGSAPG
jgi:hypothetical protein